MNFAKVISLLLILLSLGCGANQQTTEDVKTETAQETVLNAAITFIELGSVNCIPCKMMQPVMKNIERKYGDQIRVIFYDVWTPEQRKYAQQYGIRVIPTQIFLDRNGDEILRHEGFFPEAEIDRFLQSQGLKIIQEAATNE